MIQTRYLNKLCTYKERNTQSRTTTMNRQFAPSAPPPNQQQYRELVTSNLAPKLFPANGPMSVQAVPPQVLAQLDQLAQAWGITRLVIIH
jgi:hypothetical protein